MASKSPSTSSPSRWLDRGGYCPAASRAGLRAEGCARVPPAAPPVRRTAEGPVTGAWCQECEPRRCVRRGRWCGQARSLARRGAGREDLDERSHRLLVVRFMSVGGGAANPEPLAEAVTGRVCHVPAEPSFLCGQGAQRAHRGSVARGIEQAGLGEEAMNALASARDSSELLFLRRSPGRVQLEVPPRRDPGASSG